MITNPIWLPRKLHGCVHAVTRNWIQFKKYFVLLLTDVHLSTKFQNALRNSVAWHSVALFSTLVRWTHIKYVFVDYDTLLGKNTWSNLATNYFMFSFWTFERVAYNKLYIDLQLTLFVEEQSWVIHSNVSSVRFHGILAFSKRKEKFSTNYFQDPEGQ